MLNEEQKTRLNEVIQEIQLCKTKSEDMKIEADKLVYQAQFMSQQRLELLEKMQKLAQEYQTLKGLESIPTQNS